MVEIMLLRKNEWLITKCLLYWENNDGWKTQEEIINESKIKSHRNNLRFHYLNPLVRAKILIEGIYPFLKKSKLTKRQQNRKHPSHWKLNPSWKIFKLMKMAIRGEFEGSYFKNIPITLENFEKSNFAGEFNRLNREDKLCDVGVEKEYLEKRLERLKNEIRELERQGQEQTNKELIEILGQNPYSIKTTEVISKNGGTTPIES